VSRPQVQTYPGQQQKNGIIPIKNAVPFLVSFPVHFVPFSVPFPFILEKMKTDGKIRYTVADETGFIPPVFNFMC
jgi:hypothetical protein